MHAHQPNRSAKRKLGAALLVTATLMAVEVFGGILSGSLALLADAGHMLTDFLALGVAYAAVTLSAKPADKRRTYGYRRLEILGALVNGVALVLVSGFIAYQAIGRWQQPQAIDTFVMGSVATVGLLANLLSLWLLRGHSGNLNLRGAFLHVATDTMTSIGVIVGAVLIAVTGWVRADPLISLGIAVAIIITSVSLLKEVVDVLLESAPLSIDSEAVRRSIGEVHGVDQVHDLHVWSITSGMPALSAHVVVSDPRSDHHTVLSTIQKTLRSQYAIDHSTLQIEPQEHEGCGSC